MFERVTSAVAGHRAARRRRRRWRSSARCGGLPLFGYAAIACLLVGAIAAGAAVSRSSCFAAPAASGKLRRLRSRSAQLRGAPGQAAVSLAAIVASFSLMAAMAIMVASFRESVDDWLDACCRPSSTCAPRTPATPASSSRASRTRVRALPQVARAEFLRSGRILLDPARPPVSLLARDRAERALPARSASATSGSAGDPPPVWVSEAVADLYGFRAGTAARAAARSARSHPFVVAGVWRDYARQHGAILIDRADYVALTGDRRVNDGALWLAPGATPAAAMRGAARAARAARSSTSPIPARSASVSLRIFDRSFAVTYALEAVAVLVGLFGLSSSLGAIVLARRREFGMLRHLGLTRGADPRDARRRGRAARAASARPPASRRRGDQPGAGLRRQPAVVPLEHGAASAVCCFLFSLALILVGAGSR